MKLGKAGLMRTNMSKNPLENPLNSTLKTPSKHSCKIWFGLVWFGQIRRLVFGSTNKPKWVTLSKYSVKILGEIWNLVCRNGQNPDFSVEFFLEREYLTWEWNGMKRRGRPLVSCDWPELLLLFPCSSHLCLYCSSLVQLLLCPSSFICSPPRPPSFSSFVLFCQVKRIEAHELGKGLFPGPITIWTVLWNRLI